MRIITGKARGVKLSSLPGEEITRPTSERTKEGVFSAIQFELEGKRVLDLFAGTGQMALEALSRGADSAVLIDESPEAIEIIKTNARRTNLLMSCKISRLDYSEFLKSASGKERFDIVFLDPPFSKRMKEEILKKVTRADILADNAIIVCETDRDDIDGDVYGLTLRKKYKYSRIITYIFDYKRSSVIEQEETDE